MRHLFTTILLWAIAMPFVAHSQSIWDGHVAFSEGRYQDAIDIYQQEIDEGSDWDWLPEIIETVEKRMELGDISPEHVHRIGVIFVVEREVVQSDESSEVFVDVTEEQKLEWLVNFNVMAQVIESFSDGGWTLEMDTVSAHSRYYEGSELAPDNPDHLDLEAYWFNNTENFDSFITLSNTRSPARGLARAYPIIKGAVYGPSRGMAAVNSETHGFPTLLHEFFHVIEWVSNAIDVVHGWREDARDNFPDWTGETEYDYYRWQFADTLVHAGWDLMQHKDRWLPFNWSENAYQEIVSAYSDIPYESRKYGRDLYDSARAMKGTNLEMAIELFEQALALNPYHELTLIELLEYQRFDADVPENVDLYTSRLQTLREASAWYWVRDETLDYGDVVGMWHREEMSNQDPFKTIDITNLVQGQGEYEATFYYLEGWDRVNLDTVYLLENGEIVATDIHEGWSGTVKENNFYRLTLNQYDETATYELKARITTSSGFDSKGQIHFRLVAGIVNSAWDEHSRPLIYPNPSSDRLVLSHDILNSEYRIYDLQGKDMFDQVKIDDEKGVVSIVDLSPGLYIFRIFENEKIRTVSFIKL